MVNSTWYDLNEPALSAPSGNTIFSPYTSCNQTGCHMEHFTKVARLTNIGSKFQFNFDGIVYLPTVGGHAAGFLLFGLRPAGIEFHCTRNPALFLQEARQQGYPCIGTQTGFNLHQKRRYWAGLAQLSHWLRTKKRARMFITK